MIKCFLTTLQIGSGNLKKKKFKKIMTISKKEKIILNLINFDFKKNFIV